MFWSKCLHVLSVPFVGQVSPPETRSPNTHVQISLRSVFIKHILSNLIFKINCKPITGSLWSVLFAVQLSDHFSDYFEDPLVEGRALGVTTDQIIEHMHSYINRLMTKSFYKLKDLQSEKTAKKQHQGILKINAFSVKIKKWSVFVLHLFLSFSLSVLKCLVPHVLTILHSNIEPLANPYLTNERAPGDNSAF